MAGMQCPKCNYPRSRTLRTKPDPGSTGREVTFQCRNPLCKVIFQTWQAVTAVYDDPAKPLELEKIAAQLHGKSPAQLQQVQQVIARL